MARYSAAYYCATGAQICGEDAKYYQSGLSRSLNRRQASLRGHGASDFGKWKYDMPVFAEEIAGCAHS